MSDIKSNSSYAISAIQFNSKSLNPLDSVNPAVIAKVKRESEGYNDCANKCQLIWQALSKNQMAGSNLTQKVLEVIFKQFQSDLYAFTKISSIKDFVKLFDQDKDGSLNPDQQISIFLFIKQRLQLIANNCLHLQLYVRFQSLMNEVRRLESYIAKWQDHLRQRVHHGQLSKYKQEGQMRLDEFCALFDAQFQQLQQTMISRREAFQKMAFYQSQQLQNRLNNPNQYLKIKPKNRLKQLQFQQKLVSLQERVYEALDFRKQLGQLQVKQKARVDKLMQDHAQQCRDNLRAKHEKQRRQLQIKLQQLQDKLIIRMKKQFQILRKKNNLHEIQIKRLQGLQKKWANKRGLSEPQLQRTKKLKCQRNQILQQYKKSMFGATSKFQDTISEEGHSNKFSAKTLLSSTMKFNISSKPLTDKPVNAQSFQQEGSMAAKINKFISQKSGEKGYSLTKMYDNDLVRQEQLLILTQQQKLQEKSRKFNFIMSKIAP